MNKFYFTYGTDEGYPFEGGWTMVIAPDEAAAVQVFRIYHPNREGSDFVNCACIYGETFEQSESYKTGNFGGYCHEIIGPYPLKKLWGEGGKREP